MAIVPSLLNSAKAGMACSDSFARITPKTAPSVTEFGSIRRRLGGDVPPATDLVTLRRCAPLGASLGVVNYYDHRGHLLREEFVLNPDGAAQGLFLMQPHDKAGVPSHQRLSQHQLARKGATRAQLRPDRDYPIDTLDERIKGENLLSDLWEATKYMSGAAGSRTTAFLVDFFTDQNAPILLLHPGMLRRLTIPELPDPDALPDPHAPIVA